MKNLLVKIPVLYGIIDSIAKNDRHQSSVLDGILKILGDDNFALILESHNNNNKKIRNRL